MKRKLDEEDEQFQQSKPRDDEKYSSDVTVDTSIATTVETCVTIEEAELLDKMQRGSRSISTEFSKKVLELLHTEHGFDVLQCKGEADPILSLEAHKFTHLVTEDGDLLIRGVNILRGFPKNPETYCSKSILKAANITKKQLREMACMASCDYCPDGLKSVGMPTAHALILKHHSLENILRKTTDQGKKKFGIGPYAVNNIDFEAEAREAMIEFSKFDAEIESSMTTL